VSGFEKSARRGIFWRQIAGGTERRRAIWAVLRRMLLRESYRERRGWLRAAPELQIPSERGFATLPPGSMQHVNAVVEGALQLVARADPWTDETGKSHMSTRLLDMKKLNLTSPFLRVALDEQLTEGVASYLGVLPILRSVAIALRPGGSGIEPALSL